MSVEIKGAVDALVKGVADERIAREAFEKRSEGERKEFEAKADERFAELQKSIEDVRVNVGRIAVAGSVGGKKEDEHSKAFYNYIRSPRDRKAESALLDIERKAVSVGTASAGGYAVPEEISRAIITQLTNLSPMRQVCDVVSASTSDYKILVDSLGTSSGWVGEGGARSETNNEVAPTFGMVYAYPKASEEALQDIYFDVAGWLTNSIATAFAAAEGAAFTSGNGTNKPTGLMAATVAADDDASLAFGSVQAVNSGAAAAFAASNPSDALITLVHKLKAGHRAGARFMMNKSTLATVRKFKDSTGNYLWSPGLANGLPSTLLGFGVVENEDMADIAANALPIAFGDFRAAYTIVDRVGLSITVDESITSPGYVKWYVRKRVGGKLTNNQAVKFLKIAA
jgi:HK97 family phage major capsid protein